MCAHSASCKDLRNSQLSASLEHLFAQRNIDSSYHTVGCGGWKRRIRSSRSSQDTRFAVSLGFLKPCSRQAGRQTGNPLQGHSERKPRLWEVALPSHCEYAVSRSPHKTRSTLGLQGLGLPHFSCEHSSSAYGPLHWSRRRLGILWP